MRCRSFLAFNMKDGFRCFMFQRYAKKPMWVWYVLACGKHSACNETLESLFKSARIDQSVDGLASALREVAPAMFEAAPALESHGAAPKKKVKPPSAVVKTIAKAGTTGRPRGRPPKGKVWDPVKGYYV